MQLNAAQNALLDAIFGREASGYNTLYGGGTFNSYAQHPNQKIRIQSGPNKGRVSTAAGKPQFLKKTWDDISSRYNLPNFSPENQRIGAWHLANETYRQQTGRDLSEALKDTSPANIADIGQRLSGKWTSLPGGIEATQSPQEFVSRFNNASGSPSDTMLADSGGSWWEKGRALVTEAGQKLGNAIQPAMSIVQNQRHIREGTTPMGDANKGFISRDYATPLRPLFGGDHPFFGGSKSDPPPRVVPTGGEVPQPAAPQPIFSAPSEYERQGPIQRSPQPPFSAPSEYERDNQGIMSRVTAPPVRPAMARFGVSPHAGDASAEYQGPAMAQQGLVPHGIADALSKYGGAAMAKFGLQPHAAPMPAYRGAAMAKYNIAPHTAAPAGAGAGAGFAKGIGSFLSALGNMGGGGGQAAQPAPSPQIQTKPYQGSDPKPFDYFGPEAGRPALQSVATADVDPEEEKRKLRAMLGM